MTRKTKPSNPPENPFPLPLPRLTKAHLLITIIGIIAVTAFAVYTAEATTPTRILAGITAGLLIGAVISLMIGNLNAPKES